MWKLIFVPCLNSQTFNYLVRFKVIIFSKYEGKINCDQSLLSKIVDKMSQTQLVYILFIYKV